MKKIIGLLFLSTLFQLFSPLYADDNSKPKTKADIWYEQIKSNAKKKEDLKKDEEKYLYTDNKSSLTDFEKEQIRIQEEQLRLQKAMLFFQMMQSMPQPQYTPTPTYHRRTQPPQQPKRYNINIRPTVINSPDSPQVYEGTVQEVK